MRTIILVLFSAASVLTQLTFDPTIIRIRDGRNYVANMTLDRIDATTDVNNFVRYGLLSSLDYQVGVSVSVRSVVESTGVNVYLRRYTLDADRSFDDYDTEVATGSRGGTILESVQVDQGNRTFLAFPLVAASNAKCLQEEATWLTIDVHLPTSLVDDAATAPSVEILIQVHWEDIRLSPPDIFNPLTRTVPILEKPRLVIADADLVDNPAGDQDGCVGYVTITVQFVRPNEQYITGYWLYLMRESDTGDNVPQEPTDDDIPDKITTASLTTVTVSGVENVEYTFNRRVIDYDPVYVIVYGVNEAGRDVTGSFVGPISDVTGTCDIEKTDRQVELAKEIKTEGEEILEEEENVREVFQKFTDLDINAVSVVGESEHTSTFDYTRRIRGHLGSGSTHHLFNVAVSDMSTYNLTVTVPWSTSGTVNLTGQGIQGIALMSNEVSRCAAAMTEAELIQLSTDSPLVTYVPIECSTAANAAGTEVLDATHGLTLSRDCVVDSDGLGASGTLTMNLHKFCTAATDPFSEFSIVLIGANSLTGSYHLLFEMSDYFVSQTFQIHVDLFVGGSSVTVLSNTASRTAVATLLSSKLSTGTVTVDQVTTDPQDATKVLLQITVSLAHDSSLLTSTVSLLHNLAPFSTTELDSAINTATGVTDTATTSVFATAAPSVELSGCMDKGESRDFSVPYSGCSHPIVDLQVLEGQTRGMYLRKDASPNSVSQQAVAAWPDTRVVSADTCLRDQTGGSGLWYGQLFLLEGQDETFDGAVFRTRLSLLPQEVYITDDVDGFVCCEQLLLYRYQVPANKQLAITVTVPESETGRLEGLFLQQTTCPVGELVFCTTEQGCLFLTDDVNGEYSITAPIGSVADSVTEWCVGVKAKQRTLDHNVNYVLANNFAPTPDPTETPVASFNPCHDQDLFCEREFVQSGGLQNAVFGALTTTILVVLSLNLF